MKLNKLIKKNKVAVLATSGAVLVMLAGGAYYLNNRHTTMGTEDKTPTKTETVPNTQVQENVEKKSEASAGNVTTTPAVTTTTPIAAKLTDVSLSVLLDYDKTKAYVSLYGPAGTYGLEKLVGTDWVLVADSFDYVGHGGSKWLDTIPSSAAVTHYRVFKSVGGTRTAVSGDTSIVWQDLLDKQGNLTVPLAG